MVLDSPAFKRRLVLDDVEVGKGSIFGEKKKKRGHKRPLFLM
jgi:hypothetical protein